MQLKYFPDTDTLYVILADGTVVETRELNENILLDLDKEGKVVSMTIEHARQQNAALDLSYQMMANSPTI